MFFEINFRPRDSSTAPRGFAIGVPALKHFSALQAAEFQVTEIQLNNGSNNTNSTPSSLQTRVRFEFVGTGTGFNRENRVGNWDLTWSLSIQRSAQNHKMADPRRNAQPISLSGVHRRRATNSRPKLLLRRTISSWHRSLAHRSRRRFRYRHLRPQRRLVRRHRRRRLRRSLHLPARRTAQTDYFEIAVTALSKTSPRALASVSSITPPARFSPTSPIPAARTRSSCAQPARCSSSTTATGNSN